MSRLFFVAHNEHHVRIYRDAFHYLKGKVDFVCVAIDGFKPSPRPAFRQLGFPAISVERMKATAGDVIVTANEWLPQSWCDKLDDLRARGVKVAGIVEGCRFGLPYKYTR